MPQKWKGFISYKDFSLKKKYLVIRDGFISSPHYYLHSMPEPDKRNMKETNIFAENAKQYFWL